MRSSWFDVDKEGLARILKRRGLEFVLYELLAKQMTWILHFTDGGDLEYIAIYDHKPDAEEREPDRGFHLESETVLQGDLPASFPSNRTFAPNW